MSIYKRFGVEPILNASGSVTRLGGATMPASVRQAILDACEDAVPLEQLQAAASRFLAELTGAESGLVTSGAAAALTLGTAAIICGLDLAKMEQLPHCQHFPHEMLIAREQRSGYDHSIRASGATLREVGFQEIVAGAGVRRVEAWEFEAAITPQTVGIVYVLHPTSAPPLPELIAVAKKHRLPVLVDASGQVPPKEHLCDIINLGADLVAISGGKGLRGPQSTGLLVGSKQLVMSAALQMLDMDDHFELWDPPSDFIDKSLLPGMPRHGIGRGYKVGKELIIALLTACDRFRQGDLLEEHRQLAQRLQQIAKQLDNLDVQCSVSTDLNRAPLLRIQLNSDNASDHAFQVCRSLRNGSPPVYVSHGELDCGRLVIDLRSISPSDDGLLADRLASVIRE